MSNILEKYQIHFKTKVSNGLRFSICESDLKPLLRDFLMEYVGGAFDDVLQEFVINELDKVLKGLIPVAKTITDARVIVYMDSTTTKFVNLDGNGSWANPDEQIPTSDFKEIALEWIQFTLKNDC